MKKGLIIAAIFSILYMGALISIPMFVSRSAPKVNTNSEVAPIIEVVTDPYDGVLIVYVDGGQGSCFVVAEQDGWYYAITAAHVVEDTRYSTRPDFGTVLITVDDEEYEGEIVRVSSHEDVALIRFKSPETYMIYSFARPEAGEGCTTVGWSDGSRLIYKGNIVSADLNGYVAANGGCVPGCSGGILLNEDNEIIGITVAVSVYRGWAWDSTILYTPARFAQALMVAMEIE